MNKIVANSGHVISGHPKRDILCIMLLEVAVLMALMLIK